MSLYPLRWIRQMTVIAIAEVGPQGGGGGGGGGVFTRALLLFACLH